MLLVFHSLLVVHVVAGTIGLATLWPPLVGAKGGATHKAIGRVFAWCLIVTGICAAGMSLCTLYAPLETHPKLDDLNLILSLFGWMMLYLSTFTVALAWYGLQCARLKRDHKGHRNPLTVGLQIATLVTAVLCAGQGLRYGQPLMLAIASLGLIAASLNLRYIFSATPPAREWTVQHMRCMVGAGVSVYTAFFSFGAANLLPAVAFNPILWASPTLIGIAVIATHQLRLRGGWGWTSAAARRSQSSRA